MKKIKLLNALPISAIQLARYKLKKSQWSSCWLNIEPISKKVFFNILKSNKIESYIGHLETAKLLGVKYNRKEAKIKLGETFLVVSMKRRPKGDEKVKIEDLKFFRVFVPYEQWSYEII